MNQTLKKEIPIIGIVLLPFIYLAFIWNTLPSKVPIHWNYKGEIDQWDDKFSLIGMLFMLPIFMYVILLIIPKIDPKKRLSIMAGKYYQIKFFLVLFMSLLAISIIFISKNQSISSPSLNLIPVGILFIIMGNYFKVIQPNYFLGIRTPWTLENDVVWRKTHILAGKLWFLGGIMMVLGALIFDNEIFNIIFIVLVVILVLIPIVNSYIIFKQLEKIT